MLQCKVALKNAGMIRCARWPLVSLQKEQKKTFFLSTCRAAYQLHMPATRGGHGSGLPESTPARFYVFLSGLHPESKIY